DVFYEEDEQQGDASQEDPDDQLLGAALREGKNSIIVADMKSRSESMSGDPIWQQSLIELRKDLELSPEAMNLRLAERGVHPTGTATEFNSLFAAARERAMGERIAAELEKGVTDAEQVRTALLPHSDPSAESPQLRLLAEELRRVRRSREMERFFFA